MKTFRTPTIKATVNYDPALLKSNHIYLAATDNEKIYVDDLFQQMPLYVRTYLLLHEEGHIIAGHHGYLFGECDNDFCEECPYYEDCNSYGEGRRTPYE